jgi:HEAT repeat protein
VDAPTRQIRERNVRAPVHVGERGETVSRGPALWAALLGVATGFAGGVAGARLLGGGSASDVVRRDLDRLEAASLAARAETAASLTAVAARIEALESAVPASGGARSEAIAESVRAVAADLGTLRDSVVRDLGHAERRIAELERRVDQLFALVALAPPPAVRGATTEEDEAAWLALARDADPLRRFSALYMLGRVRTDRSTRASAEALHDTAEIVVCQAAKNLGEFGDRSAARELAALLRHTSVSIRNAAHEALRRLGAPDTGFVASALPEARKGPAEALERWAAENP